MSDIREFEGLYARLDDLIRRADRGNVGISAFLSPRELHYAEKYLKSAGARYFAFGGYTTAERKRIYLLPEYMEGVSSAAELAEYGEDSAITVLEARESGFESLNHRSFMGAVLGLGLERDVIGDIIVTDGGALIICDRAIAEFILSSLERVGRDRVRLSVTELEEDYEPKRDFEAVSDTVASPRLDCVVGALCSLSREKARSAVEDGSVELDYECCQRPDCEVTEGALISVRGYGKFRILSLCDKTRKGRYRLLGEKFL